MLSFKYQLRFSSITVNIRKNSVSVLLLSLPENNFYGIFVFISKKDKKKRSFPGQMEVGKVQLLWYSHPMSQSFLAL